LFEPFFPESELKLLQRIQKQQIKINNYCHPIKVVMNYYDVGIIQ